MQRSIIMPPDRIHSLAARMSAESPAFRLEATCDRDVIRHWARQHQAEPATGEATPSGPATVEINDGGSGLRFNFPGASQFRTISWAEWLEHFERHRLLFVYEESDSEQIARRARELWQARGGRAGHDLDDWFEAERELGLPSARYQIVRDDPPH
jgi:hypothetical protein